MVNASLIEHYGVPPCVLEGGSMKRFHLALSVSDIEVSAQDYSRRLGCRTDLLIPVRYQVPDALLPHAHVCADLAEALLEFFPSA